MANLACLELHPHPVRATDLEHPDELRIDLDPVPGVEWPQIRQVASVVREALASFGLIGWPKTSGSRGVHVYVRIAPRWTFAEVRRAALAFAREVEQRAPSLATSKWWKEERHGVFLDYNQNAKDRTVASAYSVRPTSDARVSAPLAWDEVAGCDPAAFTVATMPERFASIGDPWAGMDDAAGTLESLIGTTEPASATRRGRRTTRRRTMSPRASSRRSGAPVGMARYRRRRPGSAAVRPDAAGRPRRSSRSRGRPPRRRRSTVWSVGSRVTPRSSRTSSPPT
jgi:hypothetical protein